MVVSRLSKACGALTLAALLAVGCGDSGSDSSGTTGDASTGGSDASAGGSDASTATGDVTAGKAKSAACSACHGTDMSGTAAIGAPNITPDTATGIGSWTTQQIVDALLKNVDDKGAALCAQMAATKTLSQTDALNIAAYLKSIPAVSKDIPDTCK
jgi:mono/diheme cytochrome c family protein